MAQPYKINGSTNGFENKGIAPLKVKFYNCEKRIGLFDSGVEKLAAQNVASQGPVHDCMYLVGELVYYFYNSKHKCPMAQSARAHDC